MSTPDITTPVFPPAALPAIMPSPLPSPVITQPASPTKLTNVPLASATSAVSSNDNTSTTATASESTRRPLTRSQTASAATAPTATATSGKNASWADVITKADAEIADAQPQQFHTRPRGRPPLNHQWDAHKGKYVPTNIVLQAPSAQRAFILAAMQSDLVSDHRTPKTFEEAVNGPDAEHWKAAIQDEIASLHKCAVWKVIVLKAIAPGSKAIPTKWVFKLKSDGHGRIARYKARLVVCGYRQKFGRDYDLTYAPVAHAASIRLVLSLAVTRGLLLRQYDIKTAFLYGVLPDKHKVYLQPPTGVNIPNGHVLRLVKAMYGLRQAPLMFNRHLHQTLANLHFKRSKFDPCVYVQRQAAGIVFLAVVVDDIIAASNAESLLHAFEVSMRSVYQLTSLGVPTKLVGLNIQVNASGLTLDQVQFVKDMARDFKQTKCKPVATPIAPGDIPPGQSPLLPPGHRYLSLVGSLLWASMTRPDIAVAVGIACTKSKAPTNKGRPSSSNSHPPIPPSHSTCQIDFP